MITTINSTSFPFNYISSIVRLLSFDYITTFPLSIVLCSKYTFWLDFSLGNCLALIVTLIHLLFSRFPSCWYNIFLIHIFWYKCSSWCCEYHLIRTLFPCLSYVCFLILTELNFGQFHLLHTLPSLTLLFLHMLLFRRIGNGSEMLCDDLFYNS